MKILLKIKNILLAFALLISGAATLGAQSYKIADSLKTAQEGDFLVSAHGKNFTLLHVVKANEDRLVIEEITAPAAERKKIRSNWQEWLNQHAPNHLSWVMYELNFDHLQIDQMYSFSQKSWQKVYPQEQILPTILALNFSEIREQDRKKAGPRPPLEMPDGRSIWNPPVFCAGKKLSSVQCSAYQAIWPQDQSELSGKKVEIYIPKDCEFVPTYFPFWIQVSNHFAQAKMRVVDSGRALSSPYKSLPIPPLELVSHQFAPNGSLTFNIKAHASLQKFNVYIREQNSRRCQSIPFELTVHAKEKTTQFIIENKTLNTKFKSNCVYYFIFEPSDNSHLSVETIKPIGIAKAYVRS